METMNAINDQRQARSLPNKAVINALDDKIARSATIRPARPTKEQP